MRLRCLGILLFIAGCATPMPPSGGPPDQTPPFVVSAEPADGSVNVSGNTVTLRFSEWVNQQSFEQALSVNPEPEQRLNFRWRRRTVEITFPEDFRANTTYVLTLDTDFRDHAGVRLRSPITLAFSTGPTINRGRIEGRVVDARLGRPMAGIDMYAYRATSPDAGPPAVLPNRPDYRTQSDADGAFHFQYLSEDPFYVVAIRDANRNRRVDPGEVWAAPPEAWIVADSASSVVARPWVVSAVDQTPPALTRVRGISDRRIELRFDEPVVIDDLQPENWSVADSASGAERLLRHIYRYGSIPNAIYVEAEERLPNTAHLVTTGAVADTAGNQVAGLTGVFVPSTSTDTLGLRLETFVPDTSYAVDGVVDLLPWQRPGFALSRPATEAELRSLVSAADTTGTRRIDGFPTTDGTTYGIETDPPFSPGETLTIRIDAGGQTRELDYRVLDLRDLGEISGRVNVDEAPELVVIEVYEGGDGDPLRTVSANPDGTFLIDMVPEGTFRLRAFHDLDADGRWSPGALAPYEPAEPVMWLDDEVAVRPRWETALPTPITFTNDAPPALQTPDADSP